MGRARGKKSIRCILIRDRRGSGRLAENLLRHPEIFRVEEEVLPEAGLEYIEARLDCYEGVILGDMPPEMRDRLLILCFDKGLPCWCEPTLSDILVMSAKRVHTFDSPLVMRKNRVMPVWGATIKRAFDVLLSATLLLLLSPLLLLIGAAVKICDGGPIFYRQARLTRDGKVFDILKFRTMRVDAEPNGPCMMQQEDERVTSVGLVLRRLHLDELPQLVNILRGEMSLVGPRPERPEIAAEYEKELPAFRYRLKVKAGLTGYAQVYGKYSTAPVDKLRMDLMYIEKFSIWMDLWLMLATFKTFFQRDGTEGIENGQRTAADSSEVFVEAVLVSGGGDHGSE